MLAARITRHTVVGTRAQGFRLLQFVAVADEHDVCSNAGRELAREPNEIEIVREHERVHANRQPLERVGDDVASIDFEIRHVQEILEALARLLAVQQQERGRVGGERSRIVAPSEGGCCRVSSRTERRANRCRAAPAAESAECAGLSSPSGSCRTGRSALRRFRATRDVPIEGQSTPFGLM